MGLIEPVPAPEIFCSGLGGIEDIGGGCLRFYLYVLQQPVEFPDCAPQKVIVAKVIAPAAAVPDAVQQMVRAISAKAASVVLALVPH